MKKQHRAPLIVAILLSVVAFLASGAGIAFLVLYILKILDASFINYALYSFGGGTLLAVIAFLILIINKKGSKKEDPNKGSFLNPHPELLDKEGFFHASRKETGLPVGCFTYLILSSLSDDERKEVSARINDILYTRIRDFFPEENSLLAFEKENSFYVLTRKGDIKAKMEETAKQILGAFALDPTLPDIRLLLGLEKSEGELEQEARWNHAKTAATYDALSRLSGALNIYEPSMEIDYRGLTFDLKAALEEGRVEISYAPLLNKANKTHGYRRVLRLFDPSRGLIEEEELRRLADNVRQGELLDRYAIDKTLDDLALWDEGVRHKLAVVLISVGKATFYRASFLHELRRSFAERGFDLSRLCLAINGADLVSDEAYCANFSKRAHSMGIKIAILGFSSRCPLVRINELNPDIVSFDRSFFEQDARLGKAKIEVLKNTAQTIAFGGNEFSTIPDLYPEKDVTPALALERLQNEEEFRR